MIDKKPAVGRIAFRCGYLRGQYFVRAGEITKLTDATVKYRTKDGDESHVHRRNVSAVCDTEEEANQLHEFSEDSWRQMVNFEKRFALLSQEFFK